MTDHRITVDALADMRERQRGVAARGMEPEAAADLDALLREIGRLSNHAQEGWDAAEQAARERDAYQRAKAENDERFQLAAADARAERDAATARAELLQARLAACRTALTDRVAELKDVQERWRNMPTSAMDTSDWFIAENQQHRLGEAEDLLERFDAAAGTEGAPDGR